MEQAKSAGDPYAPTTALGDNLGLAARHSADWEELGGRRARPFKGRINNSPPTVTVNGTPIAD